jgi:hypothetical protein
MFIVDFQEYINLLGDKRRVLLMCRDHRLLQPTVGDKWIV